LVIYFSSPFSELVGLTWLTNHHPSVLRRCWLGHMTHKIISEMTYDVSSGMLNTTIPHHTNYKGWSNNRTVFSSL